MSALVEMPQEQPDVLTVVIRDAEATDWPYIEDSWEKSLARAQRETPSRGWYDRLRLRIARLRERGARFLVASDPADKSQILGWACIERPVVHYVFVKLYFREQGIARQLTSGLADQPVLLCSEWTPTVSKIARRHPNLLRKVLPC